MYQYVSVLWCRVHSAKRRVLVRRGRAKRLRFTCSLRELKSATGVSLVRCDDNKRILQQDMYHTSNARAVTNSNGRFGMKRKKVVSMPTTPHYTAVLLPIQRRYRLSKATCFLQQNNRHIDSEERLNRKCV